MKNLIWYEKYRQKDINKLSLNEATLLKMNEYIQEKQIPHLLFSGPPGSGKTTLAKILIDRLASSCLELNGSSNDRGIEVIKGRVKDFAGSMRRKKDKLNIVFFDEADGLTRDAQKALKNTTETFHKNCRFIFTANDLGSIDEAIFSRCTHFRFEQIPKNTILKYCKKILKSEKIEFEIKDLKILLNMFYPDIRSLLNNLNLCSINGKLNKKMVTSYDIDKKEITKLLDKGEIGKIRGLWKDTISFNWLYKFLMDVYVPKIESNEAAAVSAISTAEYMIKNNESGADKEIIASACLIDICMNQDIEVKF